MVDYRWLKATQNIENLNISSRKTELYRKIENFYMQEKQICTKWLAHILYIARKRNTNLCHNIKSCVPDSKHSCQENDFLCIKLLHQDSDP